MPEPFPQAMTAMLRSCLDVQREHVIGILEGLDEQALRRPMLASGWSCVDVLQHLAVDIERFWFRAVIAGESDVVAGFAAEPGDAWPVGFGVSTQSVLESYRDEVSRANAIIDATPLDTVPAWWPGDLFGEWRIENLAAVLVHVIAETACHAGHLDAARELMDGRLWMVLS